MKWYDPKATTLRQQCPCCGCITLPDWGVSPICPGCFREDDAFVGDRQDEPSACSHLTPRQGRAGFAAFGGCDRATLEHVIPAAERSQYEWGTLPLG